jgi:hypothetical protein
MLFASLYRATRKHEVFGLNPMFRPWVTFSSAAVQAAILVRYDVFLEKSMKNKALWLALQVWRLLWSCETPWATRASGGKDANAKADEQSAQSFCRPSSSCFFLETDHSDFIATTARVGRFNTHGEVAEQNGTLERQGLHSRAGAWERSRPVSKLPSRRHCHVLAKNVSLNK